MPVIVDALKFVGGTMKLRKNLLSISWNCNQNRNRPGYGKAVANIAL